MFRYFYDEDEDEYGYGFHNPMDDIARRVLMQRLMYMQSERVYGSEKSTFIKGWSTRRSVQEDVALKPTQSAVSIQIAPLFNLPDEDFSDLIIISNGCRRLYVNQLVVASWSNVLKRDILAERRKWDWTKGILSHHSELFNIELTVEDDNEDTVFALESFFRYMYTESVDLSLETVWAHISLAFHYEVDPLLVVCMQFLQRQLSMIPIRPSLVKLMDRATKHGLTKTVIGKIMLRLQSELFFEEAEIVSSFDVDFLCDVLRSSDVVANSEYDIFQKLKPKLADLKKAGKIRQVQRLLGLLRLSQMKTSEIRELSSGEYMDEMREAFPGKLESALWSRALFNEQSWDALPLSTEKPRLYLEVPVPYLLEYNTGRNDEYEYCQRYSNVNSLKFEQKKFEALHFKIKGGEQIQGVERPETLHSWSPVYQVTNGEHSSKQLTDVCRLEIPAGKFEFVTVNYKLPKVEGTTFKLVMVFCIQTQAETRKRVFVQTDDTIDTGVQCPVFPLPISEDCDVSLVDAVCYAYNHVHGMVPRMTWNEALKVHSIRFRGGQLSAAATNKA